MDQLGNSCLKCGNVLPQGEFKTCPFCGCILYSEPNEHQTAPEYTQQTASQYAQQEAPQYSQLIDPRYSQQQILPYAVSVNNK